MIAIAYLFMLACVAVLGLLIVETIEDFLGK